MSFVVDLINCVLMGGVILLTTIFMFMIVHGGHHR